MTCCRSSAKIVNIELPTIRIINLLKGGIGKDDSTGGEEDDWESQKNKNSGENDLQMEEPVNVLKDMILLQQYEREKEWNGGNLPQIEKKG